MRFYHRASIKEFKIRPRQPTPFGAGRVAVARLTAEVRLRTSGNAGAVVIAQEDARVGPDNAIGHCGQCGELGGDKEF